MYSEFRGDWESPLVLMLWQWRISFGPRFHQILGGCCIIGLSSTDEGYVTPLNLSAPSARYRLNAKTGQTFLKSP
jgi:hypothetical protein